MRLLLSLLVCSLLAGQAYSQQKTLAESLLFHASFDETGDADFAKGDPKIYTAKTLKREKVEAGLHSDGAALDAKSGRYGGGLNFTKKTNQIVFFKGPGNLPSTKATFQGTYSFWMRLTPDEDLPPGFVDPLQITDKKWNDAAFFVDFTKESPRVFRLGAYSDYKFWNPKARKYDDIPDSERPLVSVAKPPFARDRWTHVGITFRNFNRDQKPGVAALYLNGEKQGELNRNQRFTWGKDRLVIMLGIYYVGQLDDFAIFDRALTESEIQQVYRLPGGVKSLRN